MKGFFRWVKGLFRRVASVFNDSPTFGQDRANLFSGTTISVAGLVLNIAVMMLVTPLMLDPNDFTTRQLSERLEFGQLVALILLGGAAAFATLLIPLRLISVFWGPRLGRYFDQIVLSGISPVRFVAGKVLSQNLFLGLSLFILLPYFVLSVTMGGVDWWFVVAAIGLIWLYSMMLALVTLWVSLYTNELVSGATVIVTFTVLSLLGCAPLPFKYPLFPITPFPALMQPVYQAAPAMGPIMPLSVPVAFGFCAVGMGLISCLALFGIYMGPLYGIVRENSTFGEVVKAGDSKRKRWFRLRQHIQRPSEIAFFYQNRDRILWGSEGFLRWGVGLGVLVFASLGSYAVFLSFLVWVLSMGGGVQPGGFAEAFHIAIMVIHGVTMLLAVALFSHTRNTTYQTISFLGGLRAQVSKLDFMCFTIVALMTTVVATTIGFAFEAIFLLPRGVTLFPTSFSDYGGARVVNVVRLAVEGGLMISLSGVVLYAIHRCMCLVSWVKSVAVFISMAVYGGVICAVPAIVAMVTLEMPDLEKYQWVQTYGPEVGMISPGLALPSLFGELPRNMPPDSSRLPFYIAHGVLFVVLLIWYHKNSRLVDSTYLAEIEATA